MPSWHQISEMGWQGPAKELERIEVRTISDFFPDGILDATEKVSSIDSPTSTCNLLKKSWGRKPPRSLGKHEKRVSYPLEISTASIFEQTTDNTMPPTHPKLYIPFRIAMLNGFRFFQFLRSDLYLRSYSVLKQSVCCNRYETNVVPPVRPLDIAH